jgi:hypothetical protein
MTPTDELRQLWQSDINEAINQRDLLRELERRTRNFDRTIRLRDLRETVAGLIVTVVYLWFAIHAGTVLERIADLWLAAWGVWTAIFLRRYFKLSRKPAPEQRLAVYRQALMERYDGQIRLSKSVKYWYILPMWLGLLLFAFSDWVGGGGNVKFIKVMCFVTAGNAFVWWLNEGPGIRYLQRKRRELAVLMGEEGASK